MGNETRSGNGFGQAIALGEMQMLADDLQSAIESFERALGLLGNDPAWRRERAEARFRIAECHRRRAEYGEALAELHRVRQSIDPEIDRDLEAKLLGRTGMVHNLMGEHRLAESECGKAYEVLRAGNDNEEIGLLELTLGNTAYRTGQFDRAREFYESALFTFRRIDHREGIARALNNLGVLLKSGPRWREALDYMQRALAVSEEAGNLPGIASHSLNLGILYTKRCDWTSALQALSRALLTFREIDNSAAVANAHLALGNVKHRLGQKKSAASHYHQALDMARKHGYRRESVLALEFLAESAVQDGSLAEARNLLHDALTQAESIAPEGDLVCEIQRRLAEEALQRGDAVASIRWATDAARIAIRIHNDCERGAALRVLGEAAWESGRPERALKFLKRSCDALASTPDVYEETLSRIRYAALLLESARLAPHDVPPSPGALEMLEPIWEVVTKLDIVRIAPEFVDVHARALMAEGDLEGALRSLDRGLALLETQGLTDGRDRLAALKQELAENQAECLLGTTEEFQILQEFTPLDTQPGGGRDALQRLLEQMAGRLRVDRALLGVGPSLERLRAEAGIGFDRPAAALRALDPLLRASLKNGRTIWLGGRSSPGVLHPLHADRWRPEGPFVVLRLRPSEGLWGIVMAERGGSAEAFGSRDLRLLSLFGSLISVTVAAREQYARDRSEQEAVSREGDAFSGFLTVDSNMRQLLTLLRRVSDSEANILLTGETGTGKGLLARCIHEASRRRSAPFVQVNCAALPEQLLESELFGHVQGAFTGAIRTKRGLIEEAEGGTLFLDEVDRAHRNVQAKLLHVLDRREFRPVGETRSKTANVRILCATNTDLSAAIREGLFLEDLYYRLNDFQFHIPPLRERREDIPVLVRRFQSRFTQEMDRRPAGVTREVLRRLMDHDWRGNVRELEKCVRRLVVLSEDGEWIGPDLLPPEVLGRLEERSGEPHTLREAVAQLETELIRTALHDCGGNKSEASRRLRLSYPALLEKIRRYGLEDLETRKRSKKSS
ncbi:MAG: sigma 54-interacting transcriptional regulator [Candidatus Eisenbacteria bacterium]